MGIATKKARLAIVSSLALAAPILFGSSRALAQYTYEPLGLATNSTSQGVYGSLTLIGNTHYGTTGNGGAYGDGSVFSIPITGGPATTLASFNGTDGLPTMAQPSMPKEISMTPAVSPPTAPKSTN
jgi:uncharacterized repeat protein (TIGR03803 family)